MTIININDELHKEIGKLIIKDGKIEYPSVKNFVDKAIRKALKETIKTQK